MSSAYANEQEVWKPRVTTTIIALNIIAFGISIILGLSPMSPSSKVMLSIGGSTSEFTVRQYEWWRLVTSTFLHYGLIHIASNMFALWNGRFVERIFGPRGYVAIYAVSGLIGGVVSLLRNSGGVSAGASGAVFGVFGAFGAFLLMHRSRFEKDVWRSQLMSFGGFLGLNVIIGLAIPQIDMAAHIGGLLGGAAAAWGLVRLWRRGPESSAARRAPLIVGACGVAVTVLALVGLAMMRR